VRDTVIHSADGICKLCKRRIHNVNFDTFNVKDHIPELQCHHIIPLSGGGQDSVQNCEALCPDCHRRKHLRNDINNPLE
jgi:5-methylcytosine-specific restriction protein A